MSHPIDSLARVEESVSKPLVGDWDHPLTMQECFSIMYKWAMTHPQCINGERCRYRHNGNACLVGALIPDSLYTEDLDDKCLVAQDIVKRFPQLFAPDVDARLLRKLQTYHDHTHSLEGNYKDIIKQKLDGFARDYFLIPEI